MGDFKKLQEAMERIEPGAGARGGMMPFKDVAYMESLSPKDSVCYHNTNWIDSKYDGEQVKYFILMFCRKTPEKSSTKQQ